MSTSPHRSQWPLLVAGAMVALVAVAQSGERLTWTPLAPLGLLPLFVLFVAPATANGRSTRQDIRRGGLLVAVGLWLLASSLELGGIDYSSSWPLLLVLIGLVLAIAPAGRKGRVTGVMLMAWGLLAGVAVNRLWGFGWWNIWPLVLVIIGIEIVWCAVAEQQPRSAAPKGRDRE